MLSPKNTWGLMVAATFTLAGLTGCANPAQGPAGAFSEASAGQTTAALAAAMVEEQDVADYDHMIRAAQGARYAVAAAPEGPKGRGLGDDDLTRLQDRFEALRAAVEARLAAKADAARKLKEALEGADVTTDAAGNQTRTFAFEDSRTNRAGTRTRAVESTVTVDAEGMVLSSRHRATLTVDAKGDTRSRTLTRTRTLQEDGSVVITFHREHTFKDGRGFTADWTKTISPEGGVTGTGSLTFTGKDGATRTTDLSFGGTAEAPRAQSQNGETEVTVPGDGKAYGKGGKPVATEGEAD